MMARQIKTLFILMGLYIYLFNPIFAFTNGIGSIKFLYLFFFVYFLRNSVEITRDITVFKKELFFFMMLLIYTLFRFLIGGELVFVWNHFSALFEHYLIPLMFVTLLRNNGILSESKLVKTLVVIGSVASIISVLCMTIPSFGYYIKFVLLRASSEIKGFDITRRGFGLATELYYGYGIVLAVILSYGVYYISRYKWFIALLPVILVAILINVRTGFVLALILIVVQSIASHRIRQILFILITGYLFVLATPYVLSIINIPDETLGFIQELFEEVNSVSKTHELDSSNTFDTLTNTMVILPNGVEEWLWGKGRSIFLDDFNNSDIGFILQLNYGGVIFMMILFAFWLRIISNMRHHKVDKVFIYTWLIVLLISNFKGNYIYSSSYRLMLLVYYFKILESSFPVGIEEYNNK